MCQLADDQNCEIPKDAPVNVKRLIQRLEALEEEVKFNRESINTLIGIIQRDIQKLKVRSQLPTGLEFEA